MVTSRWQITATRLHRLEGLIMGKPYATELENLPHTYAWSLQASVAALTGHIQSFAKSPLLTIGSGGSFTAASFSAYLHQVCTGQIAKYRSPLKRDGKIGNVMADVA